MSRRWTYKVVEVAPRIVALPVVGSALALAAGLALLQVRA